MHSAEIVNGLLRSLHDSEARLLCTLLTADSVASAAEYRLDHSGRRESAGRAPVFMSGQNIPDRVEL